MLGMQGYREASRRGNCLRGESHSICINSAITSHLPSVSLVSFFCKTS